MEETNYNSYLVGELPEGCKKCVLGTKMVLYVTGLCPRNCFYCPLSEKRQGDNIFANERSVNNIDEIKKALKEAREERDSPSLIIASTTIGKGLSSLEGKEEAHAASIDEKRINELKEVLNYHADYFGNKVITYDIRKV